MTTCSNKRDWFCALLVVCLSGTLGAQETAADPGALPSQSLQPPQAAPPTPPAQPPERGETPAPPERRPESADAAAERAKAAAAAPTAAPVARVEELIRQGDAAMQQLEPNAALQLYARAVALDSHKYEALWKTGRALIDVGELEKRGNSQKDKYNKALKYAERAIQVNPDDAEGHFVRAYALERVALFEGGKTKLRLAREVKAEALRAIDLNPLHDGAYHIMGGWNYDLADLGFVQRALAKTLQGGVPKDASFENAAHYYELAIQANPDHVQHHVEYARTLMKLDRKEEARAELREALRLPPSDLDDQTYRQAAEELLEKLS